MSFTNYSPPLPSVAIVGGGAFGTSTAYHLVKRGYTKVVVLDRFAPPSKDAAATDLNKIVRYDYPHPLYNRLGRKAMQEWKSATGLFRGMFHPSGWIMAAHEATRTFLNAVYEIDQKGSGTGHYVDAEEIRKRWPAFTGTFSGWTNLWSPEAGWVSGTFGIACDLSRILKLHFR